jgi:hypothetical protein
MSVSSSPFSSPKLAYQTNANASAVYSHHLHIFGNSSAPSLQLLTLPAYIHTYTCKNKCRGVGAATGIIAAIPSPLAPARSLRQSAPHPRQAAWQMCRHPAGPKRHMPAFTNPQDNSLAHESRPADLQGLLFPCIHIYSHSHAETPTHRPPPPQTHTHATLFASTGAALA